MVSIIRKCNFLVSKENLAMNRQKRELRILSDLKIAIVYNLPTLRGARALNLCEAAYGYSQFEMNVAALLELLRLPYTGSPPVALSLGLNKSLSKEIMKSRGIPTPKYQVLDSFKDWKQNMEYPLFVKPAREDGVSALARKASLETKRNLQKE